MVELYDLNNGNNNYLIWSFHKFFKIDPDDYLFHFDYELFEIKERAEYIIVFIPQIYIDNDILDVTFMKKFRFQSFDINAYEDRGSITYEDFLDTKILNVIFMDDSNTIVVLSINKNIGYYYSPCEMRRILGYSRAKWLINCKLYFKLNLKFYNSNLRPLKYIKDVELVNYLNRYYYQGEDIFIKSLYLNIFGEPFVFYVYSYGDDSDFTFNLFYINYEEFKNDENILYPELYPDLLQIYDDGFYFASPNEFVKIKDTQVAFMYINKLYPEQLVIILIYLDFYNWEFNPRKSIININLENYYPTQIKGFAYNNHLTLSLTCGIGNNNGYFYNQNFDNYLSMFMNFGYANGNDSTIDISKFLFKEGYTEDNNFFWFLYNNFKI